MNGELHAPGNRTAIGPVSVWLKTVALLIFIMVLLGGLTRLTESGLSIVDWRPLMGSVPPLGERQWQEVFAEYQGYPQYRKAFPDMTLERFKFIFYMEYSHRLLGRLIGLVFFLPFVYFLVRRKLERPMVWRGLLLLFLGGLQGFVGWYMVKSGLVDEPRVSQYRLVLHLSLAILVLSLSLWFAWSLKRRNDAEPAGASPRRASMGVLVLVGCQVLSGGFVAGLRAGHAFNTFPTMNGQWVPRGMWTLDPWFRNLFENPVTVQFFHRCLAYLVVACVTWFVIRYWHPGRSNGLRPLLVALVVALAVQVGLGITTLLTMVPVALASLHQAGALVLWTLTLAICHRCFSSGGVGTPAR